MPGGHGNTHHRHGFHLTDMRTDMLFLLPDLPALFGSSCFKTRFPLILIEAFKIQRIYLNGN